MLLHNATFYTMDEDQPVVAALAISNGRIAAAGSLEEIAAILPHGSKKVDLGGRTVLPGLTDAHIHLQNYALALQRVDCETNTRAECLQRVQAAAQKATPNEWIRGHGWNQNLWEEGFGNTALLDQIAPNNPVYLTAKSLHAGWANSSALRLAGIDANTPDPLNGRIQRDSQNEPTGILFESAMGLIENAIPEPALALVRQAIAAAQTTLWSLGLTGLHDYDRRTCFMALQDLEQSGALKLRVLKTIPLDDLPHAAALGLRTGFGSDWLRIGGVKCFADGALGPQTAAMLLPYEESAGDTGLLFLNSEQIFEIGQLAAGSGLSLTIHAIGDRANHEVLTAYARLRSYEASRCLPHLRHRIEHVQVLHPNHLNRLAELNVIASVQPIHATSDMDIADRYWGQRARYAYAFNTLLARGTRTAFGSDAPVESPNPFWGIHAAVCRRRPNGYPSLEGWYPQERISRLQALQAYTTGPAYAAGLEKEVGQLIAGCHADLIVLDEDPFQIDPQQLFTLQPTRTMVAGEWVWEK
ncbi:MAG: amidohydrolase [Bellilinea sp.]|jgi:predicted amidohydrolase YtcJ